MVAMILAACSSDSTSNSSKYDVPDVVAINNKTITGVSQKGPFVNGSSVTLQEMDGVTYAQTGKSFKGKISSDKGEFTISSIDLVSQYALLEATGYYRNEVTGKKSSSVITLNAVTDLSERSSVNINILTHLSFARTMFLATNHVYRTDTTYAEDSTFTVSSVYSIDSAKAQAATDIMKTFFGDDSTYGESEDLSIFAEGEGDAALLAMSILLQGERDEASLSELLANFSEDIEQDGKWDDSITRTEMAEWAYSLSLSDIRSNILGWGISSSVPNFEKYINKYWSNAYGLGECNASRQGYVAEDTNSLSSNKGVLYSCDSGLWRNVNYMEENIYKMSCKTDGSLTKGRVDSSTYFVCSDSTIRKAVEAEVDLGTGCTSYTEGDSIFDIAEGKLSNYKCLSEVWTSDTVTYYKGELTYMGRTYKTVAFGSQTWMAENLDYDADGLKYGNMKKGSRCANASDSSTTICGKYGRVYITGLAMQKDSIFIDSILWSLKNKYPKDSTTAFDGAIVQGVCPDGWRLPNHNDFSELYRYVDANKDTNSTVKESLRSATGWEEDCDFAGIYTTFPIVCKNGKDKFGLNILPYGTYFVDHYQTDSYNDPDSDIHEVKGWQELLPNSDEDIFYTQLIGAYSVFRMNNYYLYEKPLGINNADNANSVLYAAGVVRCIKDSL
jgi:uncharacterized protein (TIGR02145 family)